MKPIVANQNISNHYKRGEGRGGGEWILFNWISVEFNASINSITLDVYCIRLKVVALV